MGLPDLIYTLSSKALQRPKVRRGTVIITLALVAIFASALMMRIYPARYGFFIHEFDPYFDYYATEFIVEHFDQKGILGMLDYFSWTDDKTWFPSGRQVASTSQVGLHFTGAILYIIARNIFGLGISLYDFIVLFPVFIGALATLAMYLLVKRISSASAGLLAALVIAFSPPIIQRGALGWYKSEPLALFLVILGSYFFLTIYDEKVSRIGLVLRAAVSGILLGYANTAWGGSMYFNAVFGALLFLTPFLKVDLRRTVYLGSVFVAFNLIFSAIFPRPGPSIVSGPAGIALLGGLLFAVIAYGIKNTVDSRVYFRSLVKAAFVFGLIAMVVASMGAISSLSRRYQTVIDPFLRSEDPLVESVAEHQTPTGADYLSSYFALLFLAGFGAVMTVRRRSIAAGYTLILALSAIYISASFARLMVYSSVAFAILAGIGLHELTSAIVRPPAVSAVKKKFRLHEVRSEVKFVYGIFMVAILSFPVAYPARMNWLETA
ncbi:MAG: STT3 domain-containing protein, partial [Nitrososphaerales archaeon]